MNMVTFLTIKAWKWIVNIILWWETSETKTESVYLTVCLMNINVEWMLKNCNCHRKWMGPMLGYILPGSISGLLVKVIIVCVFFVEKGAGKESKFSREWSRSEQNPWRWGCDVRGAMRMILEASQDKTLCKCKGTRVNYFPIQLEILYFCIYSYL